VLDQFSSLSLRAYACAATAVSRMVLTSSMATASARAPCAASWTVGDYKAIDIRQLRRWGLLCPGASGIGTWSRNGKPTGSVRFEVEHAVVLTFCSRSGATTEWKDILQ
jgi:hypothetical protein